MAVLNQKQASAYRVALRKAEIELGRPLRRAERSALQTKISKEV